MRLGRDDNRRILMNVQHDCVRMITTDRSLFSWRRAWWAAGLGLIALLGAGLWWSWHAGTSSSEREQAAALGQGARVAGGAASGVQFGPGGAVNTLLAPTVLPDGRPSDFSPQDWAALKDAMAKTANPEAELKRVVAYLRFQKSFEQWQNLRESSDLARRQQLAAALVDQLPERLRQGEVTMGEALMLASALWTDLEPNEDKRKVRLEEVQAVLASAAPQPDAAQQAREAAQQAEYKRREAAIVLEYQSRPESQRDQAWLEGQLDTARRAVYGAN